MDDNTRLKSIDKRVKKNTKALEGLCKDFRSFLLKHFSTFKEKNAADHAEFRTGIKWITKLTYAVLGGVVLTLLVSLIVAVLTKYGP